MDAKILHNLINVLKVTGCTINDDFVPLLFNSLVQLQSENNFDAVYLWGRIVTLSIDYYIAYGYQKDPIKNRIYFYTQNILEWNIMPTDWSLSEMKVIDKVRTKFKGNPRYMEVVDNFYKKPKETSEHLLSTKSMEGEEEDYAENLKQIENLTFDDLLSDSEVDKSIKMESIIMNSFDVKDAINEENRLAITVKMIDNDCHIVPRGFFYKLPNGNIVKAPYFKGLNYSEIGNVNNFLHINPHYLFQDIKQTKPNYNGSIDFLASIDKDIPKGCWTSQTISNQYLIIHNLLWPGAVFLQDMNTGLHSFFYNGDAIKNVNLPFMI